MNLEQLQAMSDKELNRLSATKVMGWTLETRSGYIDNNWVVGDKLIHISKWNPITDMNDATQLLGKFKNVRMKNNHSGGWIVSIGAFDEYQPTLPKAITIASILAKEGET